jgi:hypothetical protein
MITALRTHIISKDGWIYTSFHQHKDEVTVAREIKFPQKNIIRIEQVITLKIKEQIFKPQNNLPFNQWENNLFQNILNILEQNKDKLETKELIINA